MREFGASISMQDFVRLYWRRTLSAGMKIPKAMDAAFAEPRTDDERQIHELIERHTAAQAAKLEQELFKQKKRQADAQRILETRTIRKAQDDLRISTQKVDWCKSKLADLRRADAVDNDARFFPGWYVPVMIQEDGRRVVKPMRYQCRPAGKPAFYDTRYPGTYNARRDNLEGFWRGVFGVTHGLIVINRFYENVSRHKAEGRPLAPGEKEENAVLEFRPRPAHDMLVACLWSRWEGEGEELLSFAMITDEPPAEVAAAGHDRGIIPIRPENIDAWLNPDPNQLSRQYAILDDRDRPYYEHRLAA